MLAAEKANLKTALAVDTLQIREKELAFYVNTLASVSTQATLLAGFAFAQLTGYSYIEPYGGYFSKKQLDVIGIGHAVNDPDDGGIGTWSWYTWLTQLCQLLFIICTAACMCAAAARRASRPSAHTRQRAPTRCARARAGFSNCGRCSRARSRA